MTSYKPTVSQQLIWIDQAINPGSAKYNIGGYAYLEGPLSYEAFEAALRQIINTQEVYSTVIHEVNYEPFCIIKERTEEYILTVIDISDEAVAEALTVQRLNKNISSPF